MLANRIYWSAYMAYHLRGQARYPFQPLERILLDQARRVQAMAAYAYRYVPYYRETMDRLGLHPSDLRSAADLCKLPIIERQQLQRDPQRFLSTAQSAHRYLKFRSGGSTGAPLTVFHSVDALFQNAAHGERERSIYARLVGRRYGYRETVIASPLSTSYEVQHFCQQHALLPGKMSIRRQYLSLLDPPEENLRRINDYRPDIIQSYGSYLDLLFRYVECSGQPIHRAHLITYSSDGLSDTARQSITKRFAMPVFSTYQAIEAFKIGFECEQHRGIHLNADLYPVRIVDADGRDLPPGESGDVIVSNLVNRATVLLNYRPGDTASLLLEGCPCGRQLPLLSYIAGRSDDFLVLPSGQRLHPQAIRTIFTNETEVWQYQVVQRTPRELDVAIMVAEACDREEMRQRIIGRFADRVGQDVIVRISFVDEFYRTAAGKFRLVQCLFDPAVGPAQTDQSFSGGLHSTRRD